MTLLYYINHYTYIYSPCFEEEIHKNGLNLLEHKYILVLLCSHEIEIPDSRNQ